MGMKMENDNSKQITLSIKKSKSLQKEKLFMKKDHNMRGKKEIENVIYNNMIILKYVTLSFFRTLMKRFVAVIFESSC